MPKIYLGLGSNQGDRLKNCREALRRLKGGGEVCLLRSSSAYETEPVGEGLRGWFINAVVEAETDLDPTSLLQRLQQIEEEMGRKRERPGSDRPIDLDLLLYGDLFLESDQLTIPHPRLHARRFVLEPLSELVPHQIHPRLGKTVRALLAELKDVHRVRRMKTSPLQGESEEEGRGVRSAALEGGAG
ncbi:MAG: 2-amino-4-hydroxy-6-hydroxymethyldihydropteridine diphosphokinase [candidate division NC10 bacterium]|nr:2-amino-4-hydroxy-6-hydroxymethyldihydropteridine diphosphokinase [candidate division NC10 bacterium]